MQDRERDTDVYNGLLDSEGGRGWDDLGEWHCNMYTIMQELNRQSMSNAGYSMLGAGAR